jgi:hypothetical protein
MLFSMPKKALVKRNTYRKHRHTCSMFFLRCSSLNKSFHKQIRSGRLISRQGQRKVLSCELT